MVKKNKKCRKKEKGYDKEKEKEKKCIKNYFQPLL